MPMRKKDKIHNDIISMFIKYGKINPDYYKNCSKVLHNLRMKQKIAKVKKNS